MNVFQVYFSGLGLVSLAALIGIVLCGVMYVASHIAGSFWGRKGHITTASLAMALMVGAALWAVAWLIERAAAMGVLS